MCEPVTITAVGLGVLGFGAVMKGTAEKAQGEYSQAVAEQNAKIDELAAQDAEIRGQRDAAIHRMKVSSMVAKQQVAYAASGVDTSAGSAGDVQAQTAQLGELDALTLETNAKREAWGYRVKAVDARAQGELDAMRGSNNEMASFLSGGASVLTGYGNLKRAQT